MEISNPYPLLYELSLRANREAGCCQCSFVGKELQTAQSIKELSDCLRQKALNLESESSSEDATAATPFDSPAVVLLLPGQGHLSSSPELLSSAVQEMSSLSAQFAEKFRVISGYYNEMANK